MTAAVMGGEACALAREHLRGRYTKFIPEQKAEIEKRAAEHGIAATISNENGCGYQES